MHLDMIAVNFCRLSQFYDTLFELAILVLYMHLDMIAVNFCRLSQFYDTLFELAILYLAFYQNLL